MPGKHTHAHARTQMPTPLQPVMPVLWVVAAQVLLLSSKAGGVGLNIIGANRLVLFDPGELA